VDFAIKKGLIFSVPKPMYDSDGFFRIGEDEPRQAWVAYTYCLTCISYSEYSETKKRCEVVLEGIKARIEEEEDIHFKNLRTQQKLGE